MAILYIKDKNGRRIPIPAIKGENGHQMFVRFSAYADGTDMSETWDDMRDYMGIAFAVDVAPADKAAYQWIRVSHFPNGMTMDEDNNLHVKGEITFGKDKFSPRDAIENITITTARVKDLPTFMDGYTVKREVLFDGTFEVKYGGQGDTYVQVTLSDNMSNYDILCFRIDNVSDILTSHPSFFLLHQYASGKYLTLATVTQTHPDDGEEDVDYKKNTAGYAIKTADGEYMFYGFDTVQSYAEPCKPLNFDSSYVYIHNDSSFGNIPEVAVKVTGYKLVP